MNQRRRPAGRGAADRRRRQEQARRAQAQADARRRRTRWWIGGGIAAAAVLALILGLTLSGGSTPSHNASSPASPSATVTTSASGQPTVGITLSTAPPPWPIPADAAPYIGAAGLQPRGGETLEVHYHSHIDVIDGTSAVTVPAYIGYLIQNGRAIGLTSLHTHDASGIVHIESVTDVPFTLGQVFTEWGVRLTSTQIGGLVSGNGMVLRVYVDGSSFNGDPATVVLRSHQEIALWFGPSSAVPQVPSSYQFPQGD